MNVATKLEAPTTARLTMLEVHVKTLSQNPKDAGTASAVKAGSLQVLTTPSSNDPLPVKM
jgi:hypothetical protein